MTPPPPGGPRDWSPPQYDKGTGTQVRPGQRPIRGGGHIEGLVGARLLAWCGIAFGATSLVFAILMPISGDPARLVWVAGFGAFAVWFALMAAPRYRSARGRSPAIVGIGVGLGIAAMSVAAYAFLVVVVASQGTRLPAPAHWVEGATSSTRLEFNSEAARRLRISTHPRPSVSPSRRPRAQPPTCFDIFRPARVLADADGPVRCGRNLRVDERGSRELRSVMLTRRSALRHFGTGY